MESPNPTSNNTTSEPPAKRKRTPITDSAPPPPSLHPTTNNVTQINYLAKAKGEKLRLIEGDAETFGDVLGMIDDYEGVLQRHESLAANLGAKLVGPLLLKSFEKLFDGPIKILQPSFALDQSPISWIDIIAFARSNPLEFTPTDTAPGVKSCRFWIKGGQLEISEDDYRLIMSGAPARMIPTQPIAEDELAELGTLNILEARLAMLIKKADTVASKARQLNYHLKGRKTAVLSRQAAAAKPVTDQVGEAPYSPPPPSFPAITARVPVVGNGETAKIQQQLLEQFLSVPPQPIATSSSSRRSSIAASRPKPSRIANSIETSTPQNTTTFHTFSTSTSPLPQPQSQSQSQSHDPNDRRFSFPNTASSSGGEGDAESQYRVLMATKIDKLAKGDVIFPPCDRCRRLKFECTKHLTACSACTRKHAKCSWRDIREGEMEFSMVNGLVGGPGELTYGDGIEGEGSRGEVNGNGEGRNGYIDPGLGVSGPGGMGGTVDEERAYREREERFNQGLRLNAEQALLSQIANAAAAAGNR